MYSLLMRGAEWAGMHRERSRVHSASVMIIVWEYSLFTVDSSCLLCQVSSGAVGNPIYYFQFLVHV